MENLKALFLGPPRRTLAVAESVTSGKVQARIGAISGASEFFLGGITAYALEAKERQLGVTGAAAFNGVSPEIARQMAQGVCRLFGADLGLATTGYAEPAAAWRVAEPFAWWALARRRSDGSFDLRHGRIDCPGLAREAAQERIAAAAVEALAAWLAERGA